MSFFPHINLAPGIIDKLKKLQTTLREEKANYEKLASECKDKQLQRTIIGLAQESGQYASEVSSQIHCLAGEFQEPAVKKNIPFSQPTVSEKESISDICKTNEGKVVSLYKELLNEPGLFNNLRKMMQYQMNGFLYSISQLRLLI